MSDRILLIDDEELFREDLASLLREEGFQCRTARSGEEGLRLVEEEEPDVVLCDLVMPDMSGVEVVEQLSARLPETPVILLTAYGTLETAVASFERGLTDYLLKPIAPAELVQRIRRCVGQRRLWAEVRYLRREVSEARTGTSLVGESRAMSGVREWIAKVSPTDSTILVTGESGTGKELVARAIHENGPRGGGPFVGVNCAALPRELFESELFGHVKGAFTGATRNKPGYFELADGGTLFLDEIAELPPELQPKLLRAIDQREIHRVGEGRPMATSARLIAATNRDLKAEVEAGRFREDLYYRLCVLEVRLPPLRERREDIPLLAEHFMRRLSGRLKRRVLGLDSEAMRILMNAPWPGNVRELENVLERAMILSGSESEMIGPADLPAEMVEGPREEDRPDDLRSAVRAYEREHIRRVLASAGGNREEAARRLGINPSTLYRRFKDLGL